MFLIKNTITTDEGENVIYKEIKITKKLMKISIEKCSIRKSGEFNNVKKSRVFNFK